MQKGGILKEPFKEMNPSWKGPPWPASKASKVLILGAAGVEDTELTASRNCEDREEPCDETRDPDISVAFPGDIY